MGTQQTTTGATSNQLQFNPGSESIYNALTGAGSKVLQGYMNDPFGNAFYKLGAGQSQQGATQLGNQNMQSLLQSMKTSGIGGNAGNAFQSAMTSNIGRSNQALRSQANMQNIFQALNRQMGATGMGMSFSPQITGSSGTSNQQTSTGGLGTWLPQLMGSALGAASGFGGFGGGGGGAMPVAPSGNQTFPGFSGGMAGAPQGGGGFGTVPGMGPAPFPSWIMQGPN
jgi:hypothetical protein